MQIKPAKDLELVKKLRVDYGIQLADLTVNTFYNSYKNIKLVENVIKELKPKNFRVSLFPRNSKNKNKNLA